MAQIKGVWIETICNPVAYSFAQIEQACQVAELMHRGKLVLCIPPPPPPTPEP